MRILWGMTTEIRPQINTNFQKLCGSENDSMNFRPAIYSGDGSEDMERRMKGKFRVGAILLAMGAVEARAAEITAADLIAEKLAMAQTRKDKDLEEIAMKSAARQYVVFGMVKEGKELAEKIQDDFYRGEAQMTIGQELVERGDLAGATEMLAKLTKSGHKLELARTIMLAMARKGQLKEAEAMAAKSLDAASRELFIGPLRAAAGDAEGAQAAVDAIKNPDRQDDVRKEIVAHLIQRGDIDAAEKFARAIKADSMRVDAASEAAAYLFAKDKKQHGVRMLAIAREGAKDRRWAVLYYWPLGHLGKAEALAGNIKEAKQYFAELPLRDMIREDAQWETVLELVNVGQHERAAEIAHDLTMMSRKVYFKFEIVKSLAKMGKKDEAKAELEAARRLEKTTRTQTEFLQEANTAGVEVWVNGATSAHAWAMRLTEPEMRAAANAAMLRALEDMEEMKK
jgi:hypothetical protein